MRGFLRRLRLDLPSALATVYAPLQATTKRIRVVRRGQRAFDPRHIGLPEGYAADLVAADFTAPVHCCFDDDGNVYITESGHKSDSPPRVIRLGLTTGEREVVFEVPPERWIPTGAATGAVWHDGSHYLANTDSILRIGPGGELSEVVTGLPGIGDHQTNHPIVGPDGRLYWGQGSVTNLGVVGADNFGFEWLPEFPEACEVPGEDIVLAGRNFPMPNVLGNVLETVECGAYVAFGTQTEPGQRIPGQTKCSGAVLRCDLDGSNLELVAWGLRNPYGLAVTPDGRLFATEHGSDERGARFIVGDPDDFYEIRRGTWYGFPDFASGIRLDDPAWGEGGLRREPILAEFPDPEPPRPAATFETHAGANGFDFSRNADFGFEGQAFVALFGDLAPITTPRQVVPAGFKVVRVDPATGDVVDFAVNRVAGPASKLFHRGFERPVHCAFGPDGALYVVDWGEINIAPEKGGVRMRQATGALWRIRRVPGTPAGERPPEPARVPFYPIQAAIVLGGVLAIGAVTVGIVRRLFRR